MIDQITAKALGFALMSSVALPAMAQTETVQNKDAILILDASGSMWGQIDGVNKIVIAKDVVEELVRGLPVEQRLGLVAYGHRKEGDCNDIQTIADVGASRQDVISAIRTLNPKGKTPLTKSVEHAANALNYTKNAANVILVSDGLETCKADPCALARTLEENGLDFTVHVIGFDVTVEERNGLKCIAEETGGVFLAADNASELSGALAQVAQAAPPAEEVSGAPVPSSLAMKATILSGGPQISSQLTWTVTPQAGGDAVFNAENTGASETEILPGDYDVDVVWAGWTDGEPKKGHAAITIKAQQPKVVTIPIDLELPVVIEAPDETPEGVAIPVTWSGPDELNTAISVNRLDDAPLRKIYFFGAARARAADETAADTDGDGDIDNDDKATALLGAPTIPGDYEIRYVLNNPAIILGRKQITVTDSQYTLSAPATAPVATPIEIEWTGPAEPGGVITLIEKDATAALNNGSYKRVVHGEPVTLTTPSVPGDYEIRYVMSGGYTTYPGMERSVQTVIPIKVTDVTATVSGPTAAVGGSTIDVAWTGPADGWADDMISIVEPGAEKFNRYSVAKLATRAGEVVNPVAIRVPAIDGEYEIVYGIQPGPRIIARQPMTITRANATVDAPDTVKAGTEFTVKYSGDAFGGDRVVIAPADAPDSKMWGYTVRYGFDAVEGETEGRVTAYPITAGPGEYEARYVTGLQHQVLARDKFTVVE
ncbi:vWA domain-containing protein [Hyphococcus lacteus]|uniref:VWA domain-containing protein n=1 Tax=Hyphococcus lacteus TaxID=3143536 RepID=A0ABV3Z072_9PROT